MKYTFPVIHHIDEVRGLVDSRPEFMIFEREHFDIISYNVMTPSTFPVVNTREDAILREFRGITFDKKGNIISRPLHKFFNLNEREETREQNFHKDLVDSVLYKMDGSMVHPVIVNDRILLLTKRGMSEVAEDATSFLEDKENIKEFIRKMIPSGITPIFEYVSPSNQIVVKYDDTDLVLVAMRDTYTGDYTSYNDMKTVSDAYNVSIVENIGEYADISQFKETTKSLVGIEGFVIRMKDGHMVKLKTDEYVFLHRSNDLINYEYRVIQEIIEGNIDDLKPNLSEEHVEYVESLEYLVFNLRNSIYNETVEWKKKFTTHWEWASRKDVPALYKSLVFGFDTVHEKIDRHLKKMAKSKSSWERYKKEIS